MSYEDIFIIVIRGGGVDRIVSFERRRRTREENFSWNFEGDRSIIR